MNFPLTRSKMLSKLQDHRKTHKTAKRTMKNLLKHTVYEFEKLTYARSGEVDMTQWRALSKALAAHNGQQDNHVTVYSKRECDAMTTDLVYKLQANDSMLAALAPSAVLVSGEALGKVENIMYALGGAHTQQGLALFTGVMYDDVVDCGVLHTLESDNGDEETSCRFLGYKYMVKRNAVSSVRYRHMVYLDYTGYTQSSNGERLGFHIEHSVDVSGFPDLQDCSSLRILQSVRYIFRQKSERVIEIYMLGNLELAGLLSVGSSSGTGGNLFSVSKLQQCAEIRRLTQMVRHRREHVEVLQSSAVRRSNECYLCHRTKRFFSSAMLAECQVCGHYVCSKCRNDKKLFVCDANTNGLLGKFQRAQTCKTCVLAASAGCASPPMLMSVSQQVSKNQGTDKASSLGSGSIYSSSSSSSIGEHLDASKDESCSYRQDSVYTFSQVDEEKFIESRLQRRLDKLQQQGTSSISMLPSETSHSVASTSLNSQTLGHFRQPRKRAGPQRQESSPKTDSNTDRRGIYLTSPNSSKLYQEEHRCRRDARYQHRFEGDVVYRGNYRQLVNMTIDQGLELVNPYSKSYSGPNSTTSITAKTRIPKSPDFQRTSSIPMVPDASRCSDLMAQMMELNMRAENTYHATQRNGVFLKHQIQSRQWQPTN